MAFSKVITALVKLFGDASPLPDFGDRAAVKAYMSVVVPDVIDIVYDAGGLDNLAAEISELRNRSAAGDDLEAIGDGKILKWLIANGPAIVQFIMTIVAVLPKQPTPNPTPENPPAPSPVG